MSRNPTARGIAREWFQGVDMMDAGAALGGLAAATMLPGMLIRDQATQGQKILKIGVAALSTVGAGFIFRNVSTNAGKMAIAGGLAGTLSQAISVFTGVQIGQKALPAGRSSIRESRFVPSPGEEVGVQVITT